MGRISVLLGSVVLMLAVTGSIASAAKPGAGTCSGGAPGFGNAEVIPADTYAGFTVTGFCVFGPGTMTINGNLTIADGAQLNDHASGQAESVHITGNVTVGKGAVLGLGDYNPVPAHQCDRGRERHRQPARDPVSGRDDRSWQRRLKRGR